MMSCYHPLRAIDLRKYPALRNYYNFAPKDRDIWFVPYGVWEQQEDKIMLLPCGQCIGCRLQRSREWANRLMLELQYHESAYFVTLTYNDDSVPVVFYTDPETSEVFPALTLQLRDLQLFFKRLRKKFGKIRYYACGEYGPETMRPHYHAIIFGLKLDDLEPIGRNEMGDAFFSSTSLSEVWSKRLAPTRYGSITSLTADPEYFCRPYGYVSVSEVTWETCAYVARYCTSKLTGKMADYYDVYNIEAPFAVMSRNPGIAKQWYLDHPDCYDYEYISISTPKGGKKFRPPRYFDKLYDVEHHDELQVIKDIRLRMVKEAQKAKLSQTSLSVDEILAASETTKLSQIKSLIRDL